MPLCKLRDNLCHCHRLKMYWRFFAYDLCDSLNQMSWTSKIRWADVGTRVCKVQSAQGACTSIKPKCHNLLRETHIATPNPKATYPMKSMSHVAMIAMRVGGGVAPEPTLLRLSCFGSTGCWSVCQDARTGSAVRADSDLGLSRKDKTKLIRNLLQWWEYTLRSVHWVQILSLKSVLRSPFTITVGDMGLRVAMVCQASHRYGLHLVDGGLPAGSLAQGLDVIDVMRNVHQLATQCLGTKKNKLFKDVFTQFPGFVFFEYPHHKCPKNSKDVVMLWGLWFFSVGSRIFSIWPSPHCWHVSARYCYSLHQQFFTQAAAEAKVRTITVEHLTASIRVHGYGVINTLVNYNVGFLKKKLEVP